MTIRRVASYAGLVVMLAGATVGLTHCKYMSDRLTGVAANARRSAANCVVQCQVVANQGIRAESELHVLQVKACNSDRVCLAIEDARHQAAVDSIQAKRHECVAECHRQGEGGSGN